MHKFIAFGPALVVLMATLVTLVAAPGGGAVIGYASTEAQIQVARQELDQDNILKQIDKAVRNIADVVEPSVVHIGVQSASRNGVRARRDRGGCSTSRGTSSPTRTWCGAGRIFVQFNDGRTADAELVGQDTFTDIAVLRVNTTGRPHIDRHGARAPSGRSGVRLRIAVRLQVLDVGRSVSGLGRDPSTSSAMAA